MAKSWLFMCRNASPWQMEIVTSPLHASETNISRTRFFLVAQEHVAKLSTRYVIFISFVVPAQRHLTFGANLICVPSHKNMSIQHRRFSLPFPSSPDVSLFSLGVDFTKEIFKFLCNKMGGSYVDAILRMLLPTFILLV